jgi:glycosyltransferase involved in cell wall biosynthesis
MPRDARPPLAFVVPRLVRGGAQQQILLVGGELRRRGWPVTVISMSAPEEMLEEFAGAGLPIEQLGLTPGRRGPLDAGRALVRAVGLLRRLRPSALIGFCYLANVLAKLAGRLAGVPVVVTSIRNERFGSRLRDRVERLTEPLADLTTTNSHTAARALLARRVASRRRLTVVPNALAALPPAGEGAGLRRATGAGDGDFVWLAVGTLTEQKDYPTLWRALARLVEEGLPVRLAVAGDGDRREDLERLARERNVEHRLTLLGTRDDVPRLLDEADGYVLSSAWEGLPNSLMEAAAHRLPCVATRVGGVEEVLEDARSGWVVPPGDPEALAGAMRAACEAAPEERDRRAAAAQRDAIARFALGNVVDLWEELLVDRMVRAGELSPGRRSEAGS